MSTKVKVHPNVGFHLGGGGGNSNGINADYITPVAQAGLPISIMAADMSPWDAIQAAVKYPNPKHFIGWRTTNYPVPGNNYTVEPVAAARAAWDLYMSKLPPELLDHKDKFWIVVWNEVRGKNTDEFVYGNMHIGEYNALAGMEILRLSKQNGFRTLLYGYAPGNPEPDTWEQPAMVELLRYMAQNKEDTGIALHEYSLADNMVNQYPHHIGRFEVMLQVCDRYKIGWPSFAITEFGWRQEWTPGPSAAIGDLNIPEVMANYMRYHEFLGATIWYLGPGYEGVANLAQKLIAPVGQYVLNTEYEVVMKTAMLPVGQSWQQEAWNISVDIQEECGIRINQEAALMKAIFRDGFIPVISEFSITYTDTTGEKKVFMAAERLDRSLPRRLYYVIAPDWGNVYWFEDPEEVEPPVNPGPIVPDVILDVTPLSQRDARWGNHILGQPTGHGETIASWGCLMVAYTVMGQYLNLTDRMPGAENDHYVTMGAFSAQFIQPGALITAYPSEVQYYGYKDRSNPAMRPQIRDWLDMGIPVPARVDFHPDTLPYEQHWVLLVGYKGDTEYWMMDPWVGDIATVNSRYGIVGSDILEAIFYKPVAPSADVYPYYRCYEPPVGQDFSDIVIRKNNWGAGDERVQMIREGGYVYLTKNSNYEKWLSQPIQLVEDTSPAPGEMYKVNSNDPWMPKEPYEGQVHTATETVTFMYSGNCQPVPGKPTYTQTTVRLYKKYHPVYTVPESGLTFHKVHEVWWVVNGEWVEKYWGVEGKPRCRWENRDGWVSWASEVIPLGQQGNNTINKVGC
jgi:hypothetical protein